MNFLSTGGDDNTLASIRRFPLLKPHLELPPPCSATNRLFHNRSQSRVECATDADVGKHEDLRFPSTGRRAYVGAPPTTVVNRHDTRERDIGSAKSVIAGLNSFSRP